MRRDSPTSADSALHGVAVHPDGRRGYVADGFSGVLVIDTATNETIGSPITIGDDPNDPYGVAVSPDAATYGSSPDRVGLIGVAA